MQRTLALDRPVLALTAALVTFGWLLHLTAA
jgi:hypothetical protein